MGALRVEKSWKQLFGSEADRQHEIRCPVVYPVTRIAFEVRMLHFILNLKVKKLLLAHKFTSDRKLSYVIWYLHSCGKKTGRTRSVTLLIQVYFAYLNTSLILLTG